MVQDEYKTFSAPCEAVYKDRNSRFLAFAYPITNAEQAKCYVDTLKKRYYDATHHCFAYRIGVDGGQFRVNDDGEPSGTAGKIILGQMLSKGLTNCIIVVVRYFGGTKLGVPGLIEAYKQSAIAVIEAGEIILKTVDMVINVTFPYHVMNDIMKVVKQMQPEIIQQELDNVCLMKLSIRKCEADELFSRLDSVEGTSCETV